MSMMRIIKLTLLRSKLSTFLDPIPEATDLPLERSILVCPRGDSFLSCLSTHTSCDVV